MGGRGGSSLRLQTAPSLATEDPPPAGLRLCSPAALLARPPRSRCWGAAGRLSAGGNPGAALALHRASCEVWWSWALPPLLVSADTCSSPLSVGSEWRTKKHRVPSTGNSGPRGRGRPGSLTARGRLCLGGLPVAS